MPLPTSPIVNTLDPARLRAILYGAPGAGKTSLASNWYPKQTLIVDVEGGTRMLPGEHFVVRPKTYSDFGAVVNELLQPGHDFICVVIDSIDHLIRLADAEAGTRNGKVAAGLVEYGKGLADRDGVVMRDLSRLLGTDLGVILIAHPTTVDVKVGTRPNGDDLLEQRVYPLIDKGDRLRQPIMGLMDFVLCVRKHGDESRDLITGAHPGLETKRRVALPDRLEADAGALYGAVSAGFGALAPVVA